MTLTPVPNIPALRKAVEFAEASYAKYGDSPIYQIEEEVLRESSLSVWNQMRYSRAIRIPLWSEVVLGEATVQNCGTAYCIAGFTVSQLPGYTVTFDLTGHAYGHPYAGLVERLDGRRLDTDDIHDEARYELGLTSSQAGRLFAGCNTVEDVRRIAEDIAGEKL